MSENIIIGGVVVDPIVAYRKFREPTYRSGLDPYEDQNIPGLQFIFGKYEGGYEWDCFGAWFDGHRYHWFSDAGCSCFGPGEDIKTLADMENGDAEALIRAYKEWAKTAYFVSDYDKVEAGAQISAAIREARNEQTSS